MVLELKLGLWETRAMRSVDFPQAPTSTMPERGSFLHGPYQDPPIPDDLPSSLGASLDYESPEVHLTRRDRLYDSYLIQLSTQIATQRAQNSYSSPAIRQTTTPEHTASMAGLKTIIVLSFVRLRL